MALAFNHLSSGFLLLTLSFGLEAATIFRPDEECPCVELAGCASMLGLTSKDGLIRSFPVCEYDELARCCDDLTGLRKLRSSERYSPPDPYLHGDRIPDEMRPKSVSGSERRGRVLDLPPGIVEPRRVVYPEYIDPRTHLGSSLMTNNREILRTRLEAGGNLVQSRLQNDFRPSSHDFLGRWDPTAMMGGVENSFRGNSELGNSARAPMGMDSSLGQRHYIHISTKPEDGLERYWVRSDGNEAQGHFDEQDLANSGNRFGAAFGTREPLHFELPIDHLSWLRHSPRVDNEGVNALPNNVGALNYVQSNRGDSKLRGNVRQTIPFVYPEYFDYRSVNRDRAQSFEPFTVSGQSNRVTPTPNIFLTPAKQEEPSKQALELGFPNSMGETHRRGEKKIKNVEVSGRVEENPETTKIFFIQDLPPAPSIPVTFGSFSRGKQPSGNVDKSSGYTNAEEEDGSLRQKQKTRNQSKSVDNFGTRKPISRDDSHPDERKSHEGGKERVVEEEHKLDAHEGEMDVEVAEALVLLNNTESKFGARLDEDVRHVERKEAGESVKKEEHDEVLDEVENERAKRPLMSDDVSPKIAAATIDRAKSAQVNNKISNSRLSALYGDGGRHHPSRKLVTPVNRRFVPRTTLPRVNSTDRARTVAKHESELSMRRQFFGRQRARSVINGTSGTDGSHSDRVIPREKPRPEQESFRHFIRQRQKQMLTNPTMEKTVRDDEDMEARTQDADEVDDRARSVEETEEMRESDEHQDLEQETETDDDVENDRSIESLGREEGQGLDEDEDENQSVEHDEPSFVDKDELESEIEVGRRYHEESDVQMQRKHGEVEENEQLQGQAVEEEQIQGQVVEEKQHQGQIIEEEQHEGQNVKEKQYRGQVVEGDQLQDRVVEKKQHQGQIVEEEQYQGQIVEKEPHRHQVAEKVQHRDQVVEEEQYQGQIIEKEPHRDQVAEKEQHRDQVVEEEQREGRVVKEEQRQVQGVEEEPHQDQVVGKEPHRDQVAEKEQHRDQVVEEEQREGRVVEEEQRQGQVVEEKQNQGQVIEEEQRQGQVVEDEQHQGQIVMEEVEEDRHPRKHDEQVQKNNELEEPNVSQRAIEERKRIVEDEEKIKGESQILEQNGAQLRIEVREHVHSCGENPDQENCRRPFEVGVPNPVEDDVETAEQMRMWNKHESVEQIREWGPAKQEEQNEDENKTTQEKTMDNGNGLIKVDQRDQNGDEIKMILDDVRKKDLEVRNANTMGDNVRLQIVSLSTERSESANRNYSGDSSDNFDNYRNGAHEDVLSMGLEENNENAEIPVEIEFREAKTENVDLSNSGQGVSLDQQNNDVHTTEVPKTVRGKKKMMRRRYGKRRRVVVKKKLAANETMESNETHIGAEQSSGRTKIEFETEQLRNERKQTNNETKGYNDKMEPSNSEEKQENNEKQMNDEKQMNNEKYMNNEEQMNNEKYMNKEEQMNNEKQESIRSERIEMNNEPGRKYDERIDSKQMNARVTEQEAQQKSIDNGHSNETAEQMKIEEEERREPLSELAEISPSDFEVLLSTGDARERESRQANSFALKQQSGVESVTISPDELALPGRITVIGPIPKGFRDPAIIRHEEELGLELPSSNAGIFRQSGSAS